MTKSRREPRWIACKYAVPVLLVTAFLGCQGSPDYVVSFQDAKGVAAGAEVRYGATVIGEVSRVLTDEGKSRVELHIALVEKSFRRFVKSSARFILRTEKAGTRRYVELVILDQDSPPLPFGSRLVGAESELELRVEQLRTNWWKNLALVAASVVVLLALVRLFRIFIWLGAALLAAGVSLVGANYLYEYTARFLGRYIPQGYRPDVVGFIVSALLIYIVAVLAMWVLSAPFRSRRAG